MSKARMPDPAHDDADRLQRMIQLGLHGLASNWEELRDEAWIDRLLEIEEDERGRRSHERRLRNARIGRFKALGDFDWSWPEKIDRDAVEELLRLDFLAEAANVLLIGPNGVGKTTIAQNLAYQAVMKGVTVRFTSASDLLHDLAEADGPSMLARRMRRYVQPRLLIIDEIGYLSYTGRHGDLLFDVVNRRSQQRSTVITTNRPFLEWGEIFPNASCVVALIDRLVHKSEILVISGDSYRSKEANERAERKAQARRQSKSTGASGGKKAKPRRNLGGQADES